jgi:hypothetical protein
MNERLDETIDRLAAELTAVPPDPGFSARVRPRLSPSPQRRPMWLVASAAAAAVIALTVIARFAGMPSGDAAMDNVLSSRTIGIGPTMFAPAVVRERAGAPTTVVVRGPVVPNPELNDLEESIAPAVDDLRVDPLIVEAMDVPAVAAIVPLDVPHLEIGDIADGEVAKEQK